MPQSMEIQYSLAYIKGDMSNFMKNSENKCQTNFLCRIQLSYLELSRKFHFVPFGMSIECFLPVKWVPYLLFGYHGNPYSHKKIYQKWTQA